MTKNLFIFILLVLTVLQASVPIFAQLDPEYCKTAPGSTGCEDTPAAPSGNIIVNFLNKVIGYLMAIGGALGVLLLVVAGFYFVSAKGDERKLSIARNMVIWVLIGVAVVFMSKFLINLVVNFTK